MRWNPAHSFSRDAIVKDIRDINRRSWEKRQKDAANRYRFAGRFEKAYHRLLHHRPQHWLDIGTGNGYLSSLTRPHLQDTTITGIDFIKEILPHAVDADHRLAVDIDRGSLPFASESFDYITCLDVLEHLILPDHAMEEIHRVLKPNGHSLFSVPNIQFIEYIFAFAKGKVPLPAADRRHMSVYTIKHISKKLEDKSLNVKYIAGCDSSPPWLSRISRRYLCKTILVETKKQDGEK